MMKRAWLAVGMGVLASSTLAGQEPVREGEGPRREKLAAMERKPFDLSALSALSGWVNGQAPTAADTSGKVVLIVTYSSWYPPAAKGLALAQRLAQEHGKDGLVVIAAHDKLGWEKADKPKAPEGGTFLLALDAKGELRQKLLSDQDPDFYLIDRAGQLRFADITTDTVAAGVETLLAESVKDASTLNERLAQEERTALQARLKSEDLRAQVDMAALPELPFTDPSPEAYASAAWPDLPRTDQQEEEYKRSGQKPSPVQVPIPESGWFPSKPNFKGRAVVAYFWHPKLPTSYEIIPQMNLLQRQYGRDVVVVGVLTKITTQGGQDSFYRPEDLDPEKLQKRLSDFKAQQRLEHPLLVNIEGSVWMPVQTALQSNQIELPYAAVISSDGMLRWYGGAYKSGLRGTLDAVLRADPAVAARRAAEDAYIKSRR